MASKKKDISKFQEALSSNTEFLNEDNLEDEVLFGTEIKGNQVISIGTLRIPMVLSLSGRMITTSSRAS